MIQLLWLNAYKWNFYDIMAFALTLLPLFILIQFRHSFRHSVRHSVRHSFSANDRFNILALFSIAAGLNRTLHLSRQMRPNRKSIKTIEHEKYSIVLTY